MGPEHPDSPARPVTPVVSRIVVLREPALLDRFARALGAAADPAVPTETVAVVQPTDGLVERVRRALPGAHVLTGDVDVGTAVAWNLAAGLARAPYLALLHEDTVVSPGWERALLDVLVGRDDVGVVGPRVVHADGTVQNRGWIVCDNGWAVPIDGRSPRAVDGPEELDVDVVSSACLLTPRWHWEAVGGFDEAFFPAIGVDVDLGLGTRGRGLRALSLAGVSVVHDSEAMVRPAHARADAAVRRYLVEEHHAMLARKWAAALGSCPPFPTDDRAVAASVERRLAVLVGGPSDWSCPDPDRSITAGERPADGRFPPAVELRASIRRERLMEAVLEAVLDREPPDGPDAELSALIDRSARLEAIERSRTWRLRSSVRQALHRP